MMKIYDKKEVRQATLEYFSDDTLATDSWINKYALKNTEGKLLELTPDDMHRRLAKEFARISGISGIEEIYYDLLKDFKYIIPAGSNMYGIGNNYSYSSLGNCFVIGNEADSYGGIMALDEEQVQLMKRRGGVGLDLSHLRPEGSLVSNAARTSTGAHTFMERYSNTTREVAQDGRRGALMLTMSVNNKDILRFISKKDDKTKVTGANISVRIDDEFMYSVIKNKPEQKKVWDSIIHHAWKSAEPGVLFWDKIISESPADCYSDIGFKTTSTNPCAELPLSPGDSCRLLAINLYSFIVHPFTKNAYFDFDKFKEVIKHAQTIMDIIVSLEEEKIDRILKKLYDDSEDVEFKQREINLWLKIKIKLLQGRRTGLGITAEGDMLAALGLKYATKKASDFQVKVHKTIAIEAYKTSIDLAESLGAFTVWDWKKEKDNLFIQRIYKELNPEYQKKWRVTGRRNIGLLTIAPTGTTAIMTQTTSGIEPVFEQFYERKRKISNRSEAFQGEVIVDEMGDLYEKYNVIHPKIYTWHQATAEDPDINLNKLSIEKLKKITDISPYAGATANEIDYMQKLEMQGQIQKWIDHSISATYNLPKKTTEEQISDIYIAAWKSGCKGITVYREGSRSGILIAKNSQSKTTRNGDKIKHNPAPKRPKKLPCDIHHVTALGKKWIVLVGLLKNEPYEVFAFKQKNVLISSKLSKGYIEKQKSGYYNLIVPDVLELEDITNFFDRDEQEALTRMISWGLRHGGGVQYAVEGLNKSGESIASFSKAISRTIKKYIKEDIIPSESICPVCKQDALQYTDGCVKCKMCGYTLC